MASFLADGDGEQRCVSAILLRMMSFPTKQELSPQSDRIENFAAMTVAEQYAVTDLDNLDPRFGGQSGIEEHYDSHTRNNHESFMRKLLNQMFKTDRWVQRQ